MGDPGLDESSRGGPVSGVESVLLYVAAAAVASVVIGVFLLVAVPWGIHVHSWVRRSGYDASGRAHYRCSGCGEDGFGHAP